MVKVVQIGEPVLYEKAHVVPKSLFQSEELARIISSMTKVLDTALDGVALAAPQIGIPYRIFIVRYDRTKQLEDDVPPPAKEVGVYINPEIIKTSRRTKELDEGCLSVRNIYGKTRRYHCATVRAQDVNGVPFVRGACGILSQIFQHETDHLNGILFTDHATDLYEIRPEEITKEYAKRN